MFTGIVQAKAKITAIEKKAGLNTIKVELPDSLAGNIVIGASIANNGTCLTVVIQEDNNVYFDVMEETLSVTNLGDCQVGDWVNIERAAKFGDEIGGHLLSGHVHMQASLVAQRTNENNLALCFEFNPQWRKYILPKGFIAVNGASLTLGEVTENTFWVHLIPETLNMTNIGDLQLGHPVNIEIDAQTQAVVDTVERVMAERG